MRRLSADKKDSWFLRLETVAAYAVWLAERTAAPTITINRS
jgi:hypothetical protein